MKVYEMVCEKCGKKLGIEGPDGYGGHAYAQAAEQGWLVLTLPCIKQNCPFPSFRFSVDTREGGGRPSCYDSNYMKWVCSAACACPLLLEYMSLSALKAHVIENAKYYEAAQAKSTAEWAENKKKYDEKALKAALLLVAKHNKTKKEVAQ